MNNHEGNKQTNGLCHKFYYYYTLYCDDVYVIICFPQSFLIMINGNFYLMNALVYVDTDQGIH